MKNDYNKMYEKPNPNEAVSFNSNNSNENKDDVTPSENDEFSNEYKGTWRATQRVNFRSEPSMSGRIIAVVDNGEKIESSGYYFNEKSGNQNIHWLKAKYKGKIGYTMKAFYSRR